MDTTVGGIPTLSPTIIRKALTFILGLCSDRLSTPTSQQFVVRLTQILKDAADEQLCHTSLEFIMQVSATDKELCGLVVEANGLPLLLLLLEHQSPVIVNNAAITLGNICMDSVVFRDALCAQGGFEKLKHLLLSSDDQNILTNVGWVLGKICSLHPVMRKQSNEILPLLLREFKKLNRSASQCRLYCESIGNIAHKYFGSTNRIINEGIVDKLLELLPEQQNDEMLEAVLVALFSIQRTASQNFIGKELNRLCNPYTLFHQRAQIRDTATFINLNILMFTGQSKRVVSDPQLISANLEVANISNMATSNLLYGLLSGKLNQVGKENILELFRKCDVIRHYMEMINLVAADDNSIQEVDREWANHGSSGHKCSHLCHRSNGLMAIRALMELLQKFEPSKPSEKNPILLEINMCGGLFVIRKVSRHKWIVFHNTAQQILQKFFNESQPS